MTLGFDCCWRGLGAALLAGALIGCGGEAEAPAPEVPAGGTETAATDAAEQAERNRDLLQRRIDSGPSLRSATEPPGELRQDALDEFYRAQHAILGGTDLVAGIAGLEQAVALDPEFGEAWFQLGEARHLLAMIRVSNDAEVEALALERGAIDALRMARQLLDRGSARTLDAFELDATRRETGEKLAQLEQLPAEDRAALARLRDLANEMASELPVLDEEGGEGAEEEPPAEDSGPTTAESAATA